MNPILTFLIGMSGITTALIFIAKFTIKWIGDAGLEKYKNELIQESIKYKSELDKDLETFKIKYTRLHLEQVEIIKLLYSKLIKAEKLLENLVRPIKINPERTDEELSKEVVEKVNDFIDYYDENEVIFNEETCKTIDQIKSNYIKVWNTYARNQIYNKNASGELWIKLADEMRKMYETILEGEIQNLKKELKTDFRKKLGIIEQ